MLRVWLLVGVAIFCSSFLILVPSIGEKARAAGTQFSLGVVT